MDYQQIGLKCGLEIHQQLNTKNKLFCNCLSRLSKDPPKETIIRKIRAVSGETGDIDIAALHESLKSKEFHYLVYPEETCLVCTDEEPPHTINPEALSIGLQIAIMLNCEIPDEIHVMRKTVVDGSNTSGFQRTAIVGTKGWVDTSFGKVGITNVSVEEDSCQIISKESNKIIYGLDRLGIPLVEIGTQPDIKTPEQSKEFAEKLGYIIRSTGAVKRGLGTIRQDVNVSVRGGNRIEIKGAQDLKTMPKLVEIEINRQLRLIEIHNALKNIKQVESAETDLTELLKSTKSKLISSVIISGGRVFGSKITGASGLLGKEIQPDKRFGTELSEYAKTSGVKGLIHSDEDLKGKYFLGEDEIQKIKSLLKCSEKDAFILIADKEELAKRALRSAITRLNLEIKTAVPKEVRKAEEDGTTTFMRPLPGAARLYPETDTPPIRLDKSIIDYLRRNLPELWENKIERFVKEYKLNKDVATQIVKSESSDLFEQILKTGAEPNLAFRALTSMLSELKAEGLDPEKLTEEVIIEVFKKSGKGVSKEALYEALKNAAKTGKAKNVGSGISQSELKKTVKEVISKNKDALQKHNPEQILMGEVMKLLKGKASGKDVLICIRGEIVQGNN